MDSATVSSKRGAFHPDAGHEDMPDGNSRRRRSTLRVEPETLHMARLGKVE